jgi:hypothetical protein
MAILVHFKNNDFGYVEKSELENLIADNAIYSYKTETGWVQTQAASTSGPSSSTARTGAEEQRR